MNVLFGEAVETDTKFNFNVTKTELEEYSEKLKENRKYSFLVPECYSADGRIMYTKSLFYTLKKCGFERLAGLCADFMCVAMNGFDGSHLDGILQIGNFGFFGTEEQYFESFSVLEIYSKAIASSVNDDSSNAREYLALFEEEKKLARHMANLEILAIIELS